jgi:STE24 endopeptidase
LRNVLLLLGLIAVTTAAAAPFDPVAATQGYLDTVPAERRALSDAYYEGGYWLQSADFLLGVTINLALLALGLSRRMREAAERMIGPRALQDGAYWAMYLTLVTLASFPLTFYARFVREHEYGLSNQAFGDWLGEQGKILAVGLIVGAIAVAAIYAVMRRLPRSWALWGAVTFVSLQACMLLLYPVFVAPLFNEYKRLDDPVVAGPILRMARAQGVPVEDVWVVDESRQSSRISANVSGLGATLRISLNDNLLNRSSMAEIEAVMGHEIGHYVLNHIYKSILFLGLVTVIGFAVLKWALQRALARRGAAWGVRDGGDVAGLPLVMTILSIYFFLMTPVSNSHIRAHEAEADLFGVNASGQPDGEALVDLKLGEYRKLDPGPLEEILFFEHPGGRNRILMAMRWKAEHLQESEANARRAGQADRRRGWSPESAARWARERAPK